MMRTVTSTVYYHVFVTIATVSTTTMTTMTTTTLTIVVVNMLVMVGFARILVVIMDTIEVILCRSCSQGLTISRVMMECVISKIGIA